MASDPLQSGSGCVRNVRMHVSERGPGAQMPATARTFVCITSIVRGCAQVQASAWSRWRFGDKQAKPAEVESSGAEIFIMLPLGIIAVGELAEGEEVSFIHQCAPQGLLPRRCAPAVTVQQTLPTIC